MTRLYNGTPTFYNLLLKTEIFCVNLHKTKTALLCLPPKMRERARVPLDFIRLLVYNILDKVYPWRFT